MAADSDTSSPIPRSLAAPWAEVVRQNEVLESTSAAANASSPSSPPSIGAAAPEQTRFSDASCQKPSPRSSTTETQPESSSDSGNGNAARSKKPAWNKPVNGVVEGSSVMGGSVSWPALSESTRSTIKSSSDSPKPLSDGSASSSQGPIISQTPQKQANTNANTNSVANHGMTRQKSMKHRGGGSAQGGFRPPPSPPPMPPPFPAVIEIPSYGSYGNFVPPVLDSSVRGTRPIGGVGPQSGNDHSPHSQRNSSRRNNYGARSRGDGQYHHGGRRDHDRRDVHLPNQFVPPLGGYMPPPPPPPPPPPGSASYIAPPPMRPFVGPMGFDMASPFMYVPALPPESFRGMPFIAQAPPTPMFFPVMDPPLPALIVKQIDYYFSDANLVKDDYLRSNMDDEGWVPINLIASFPRVQQLTADISLILDSLRSSVVVEVKETGDKIRRRSEWKKWTQSSSRISLNSDSLTSVTSFNDTLTASFAKISLNEVSSSERGDSGLIDSETGMAPHRALPDESTGSLKMANGEVTAEEFQAKHEPDMP